MELIRSGDVLLEKVGKIKIKMKTAKDVVLAEGEVTGHRHVLLGQTLVGQYGNERYVQLENEAELVHEEHDTVIVPKGTYKVRLQREVNLADEVRQVLD